MTPIRLLVIDDELPPAPTASPERESLIEQCGLKEITIGTTHSIPGGASSQSIEVAFATGSDGGASYTYQAIRDAVAADVGPQGWALVLLDVTFGSDRHFGESVRLQLLADFPDLPVVMLTARGQEELWNPNVPYLSKDGLSERLFVLKLVEHGRLTKSQKRMLLRLEDEVAESDRMLNVFCQAFQYAASEASILLLGETGVGKEIVARYIHRLSSRHRGPFVAENMATVGASDPAMLNIILFGRRKGYPNRADAEETGLFASANGGTLFLDEIVELPPSTQSSILRVLQERTYQRLGENFARKADFRLLTATAQDISTLIQNGAFREDLYHRIAHITIYLPPLRERPDDIVPLAEHFLKRNMFLYSKRGIKLTNGAQDALRSQSFPGNVRQLENLIQKLLIHKGNNASIFPEDILQEAGARVQPGPARDNTLEPTVSPRVEPLTLSNLAERLAAVPVSPDDPALRGSLTRLEAASDRLRKRIAGAALKRSWNMKNDKPVRAEAVRLICDDPKLKGSDIPQVLQRILDLNKQRKKIDEAQIEALVRAWESGPTRSSDPPDGEGTQEK